MGLSHPKLCNVRRLSNTHAPSGQSVDLPKVLPAAVKVKLETSDDVITDSDKVQEFLSGHLDIDSFGFGQAPDQEDVTAINESSQNPKVSAGREGSGSFVVSRPSLTFPEAVPRLHQMWQTMTVVKDISR